MLYYKSYGADPVMTAKPTADYFISIPVTTLPAAKGASGLCVAGRPGRVASPGRDDPLHFPAFAEGLGIRFTQQMLKRHLADLTGRAVEGTVVIDHECDPSTQAGMLIAQATVLAAQSAVPWAPLRNCLHRVHFRDTVLNALLQYFEHSHGAILRKPALECAPAVRRAIDYIRAYPDIPLALADLARIAQVPVRTLSEQFRRSTGRPPLAYIRIARLEAARADLVATPELRITDLALSYGWTNFGRFASQYRDNFGETPSETRRRLRKGR